MNIKKELQVKDDKPAALSIRKSERQNIRAFGLKEAQILPRHKTSLVTTLIVLQGKIRFITDDESNWELATMDVFEVPRDIYHRVEAVKESIFVLIQEK